MDICVTVPKRLWKEWIAEGDLPGELASGQTFYFWIGRKAPNIKPGDRVYIVAHGKLRGYAPCVGIHYDIASDHYAIMRQGGAVAVTILTPIEGFQGYRYRFWNREEEVPFPDWKTP